MAKGVKTGVGKNGGYAISSGGDFKITGSSVRTTKSGITLSSVSKQLTNGTVPLYCVRLGLGAGSDPTPANVDVTKLEIKNYTYGITGMKTDAIGYLYLWLPVRNDYYVSVLAGDTPYVGGGVEASVIDDMSRVFAEAKLTLTANPADSFTFGTNDTITFTATTNLPDDEKIRFVIKTSDGLSTLDTKDESVKDGVATYMYAPDKVGIEITCTASYSTLLGEIANYHVIKGEQAAPSAPTKASGTATSITMNTID